MTNFEMDGYVPIKSFIDPQSMSTISRYLEFALSQNKLRGDNSSSYCFYSDPLIETVLQNSLSHVEQISGKSLYPTYSYYRVYLSGDELKPHVDRPSCEVTATVNVATKGKAWPLWMKVTGKEPGDAVVYKGCEVLHWREKAVDTEINVQFMLHYVDQNGPYSEFKWDKRQKLGLVPN